MSDIVERIRKLQYVHVPVASQLMTEAAAEIERLRLTDAEREAVERAAFVSDQAGLEKSAATLRKLLERTK